jgi:internalin A
MRIQVPCLLFIGHFLTQISFSSDVASESAAVKKIELLGGRIERDGTRPHEPIVGVSFAGNHKFNDKFVHLLVEIENLTALDLSHTQITDAGLKELWKLTKLKSLNLNFDGITDQGLRDLEMLDLSATQITDAGLSELGELKNLTHLYIDMHRVTEAGLNELKTALPNVQILP